VKAALAPDATPAMKQQAASILRGVLAVLESGVVPTKAPSSAVATGPDFLSTVIDFLQQRLPPGATVDAQRLTIPIIKCG
jgi:hypothetical protein